MTDSAVQFRNTTIQYVFLWSLPAGTDFYSIKTI